MSILAARPKNGANGNQSAPLAARLVGRLQEGLSVNAACACEGISPALGQIIVDDLQRRGVMQSANSLCSSGLGMCSGTTTEQARLHCAGCPLI